MAGVLMVGVAPPVGAQDDRQVTVAVRNIPPFVIVGDDGELDGFSIDLWNEIADREGWETRFEVVDDVSAQLDAVVTGRTDAAMGAISVTEERSRVVDFSQPIYEGGLGVMARVDTSTGWRSIWTTLATFLGWFLLALVVVLVVAGHVIWLVERRNNDDLAHGYLRGVTEAMWFAVVTVFTVGYGDHVPRTTRGRLVTVITMIVGVILVSQFTAVLTSSLTADRLRSEVAGIDDLGGRRVLTVAGTTSEDELRQRRIEYRTVGDVEEAGRALLAGRADAVVYDAPVLQYFASGPGRGRVGLVGGLFELEYYGIAFGEGSDLVESVDAALLGVRAEGVWDQLNERWFG
jgi:polar amino acid transport system substrate-binding protein